MSFFYNLWFRLEERQKEEEALRHQIRKNAEEKSILHERLDQLKKDFLELNPRKDQKARVDAAYEKQKAKLKQKISQLERKKLHMENKLRHPNSSDMELLRKDQIRADSNGLIDPSIDSADSQLDFSASEHSLHHLTLANKNSSLSLASMDSKSIGDSSEPDKTACSSDQFQELLAQFQNQREYFEEVFLKRLEAKQVCNSLPCFYF